MSKFEMLTRLARRSVTVAEHKASGAFGHVEPGYKDSWLVGGLHPHMANRRNFSIRKGVKVAAASGVAAASMLAASAAEARSKKNGNGAKPHRPASEERLATQAGAPTPGSPEAAPELPVSDEERNDPILAGLENQVRAATRAMNIEASRGGFGDKSKKASDAVNDAQNRVIAYKKQKEADKRAADAQASAQKAKDAQDAYDKSFVGMGVAVAKEYGPYAVGAILGGLMAKGLTKKLTQGVAKKVERFEAISKEVAKLNETTAGRDIVNSSKGDKMAALLKEAFRTAGVTKAPKGTLDPLSMKARQILNPGSKAAAQRSKTIAVGDLLHPEAQTAKAARVMKGQQLAQSIGEKSVVAEASATHAAVEADRATMDAIAKHADHVDAKIFNKGDWGDVVLGGALIAEGAGTRYLASQTDDPSQKQLLNIVGMSSMAAGATFMTGRKIAKRNPTAKPSFHSVANVTAARDRLARELMRAGKPETRVIEQAIERDSAVSTVKRAMETRKAEKLKDAVVRQAKKDEAKEARKAAEQVFKKPGPGSTGSRQQASTPTGHIEAPKSSKFLGLFR
ncbi:hypothetical protein [Hyphomicrobium sp.]|uniref:hypothetical protein n=1 Tax=Hyphomicrobium sp. TaxID=82 RepID=UPI001D8F617B|nr:hypothetical protein [Hyphomicrobium sp.]MBY0559861.1 hypothetical protein [Hyphomicrobium sp.]